MKKIYTLMLLFLCVMLLSVQSFATTITIQANASLQFTPSTVNAFVGDTIHFQWVGGFHNTTCDNTNSSVLPAGATPWTQVPLTSSSSTFDYVLQVPGQYHYVCTFHLPGMVGNINATLPPPDSAYVTFSVDLSQDTICAGSPHIAGSFNGWSTTANPLDSLGNGIYQTMILLAVDTAYEYKFLNDSVLGSPCGDETVPAACNVNGNREVIVPANDTILSLVCFSSCSACIVIPVPDSAYVTFSVDLSQDTICTGSPHIAGSFNGWSTTANPLDSLGNGIYQTMILLAVDTTYQYKFLNDSVLGSPCGDETVPAACSVNGNRQIVVPVNDTILPLVCFGSCSACIVIPPPDSAYVTFSVDLSQDTICAGSPHIAGSFNGWSTTANPLDSMGNGIYQTMILLAVDTTYQYKFLNDSVLGSPCGDETVPAACNVNGNRQIVVPVNDTILPLVCFGSCAACILPPKVNVTFNVDMSFTTLGPGGPHYAGTYNGFFADVTPMTAVGGNIYSVTLALDPGHLEEYTFLKDSTYSGQEIITSACGVPNGSGGFNRFINTLQTDTILPEFCYGSCFECSVGINDQDGDNVISVYPNPTENLLYIETSNMHDNFKLKLLSMDGKLLFEKEVNGGYQQTISIDMNNFAKGVYILKVESAKGTSVQKVILK